MAVLPDEWFRQEVDCDAVVLAGFTARSMHVVAPPGVRFQPGEPDEQRLSWRHAVWTVGIDGTAPAMTADPPDDICSMKTVDVVAMLPEEQHEFVRAVMARQIRRAAAFGEAPEGSCLSDRHAQLAGRTHAWAIAELAAAFPDERWHLAPDVSMTIPHTVDELLRQLPVAAEADRAPNRLFGRTEGRRWSPRLDLPAQFGVGARVTRRRLKVMLWAAGFIGFLPLGEGAQSWLVGQVNRRSKNPLGESEQPVRVR